MPPERSTRVVRIIKAVYDEAMKENRRPTYLKDTTGWLSYLIFKGLEKIREEKRSEKVKSK